MEGPIRGFTDSMLQSVKKDAKLNQAFKDDPSKALKEYVQKNTRASKPNLEKTFFIMALVFLAVIAFVTVYDAYKVSYQNVILAAGDSPAIVPDSLVAMGSAAVGAIVGLFAPSPMKSSNKGG